MKKNKEIADIFNQLADILEIKGETAFKVLAYRRGARILENLTQGIDDLFGGGKAPRIAGIGEGLSKKIREYLETGRVGKLDEEKKGVEPGLIEMLAVPGLGPKTIQLVRDRLGVRSIDELTARIEDGSLAELFGMGTKRAENILKAVRLRKRARQRIPLIEAMIIAEAVTEHLAAAPGIGQISTAGSLRRMKETIGDIDILATGNGGEKIIGHFCAFPGGGRVLASGKTKGAILVKAGNELRQVDLRIVRPDEYGAALQYFTGSKDHNVKLRGLARDRRLKVSEYGVFRGKRRIAGRKEEEVYRALGLPWIPPELREDRGEIEAAATGGLPRLVEPADVRGDLHVHSSFSDGTLTIEAIARQAAAMGYAYVAICDHSQSVRYAGGLSPERLRRQWAEIARAQEKFPGLRILRGAEVDILPGGRLDYGDAVLEKLDIVVAAIHQGFRRNVTQRLTAALRHPLVHVIAHPTGRLLSSREGYDVDLFRVMDEAARSGKALELNCAFDRFDLNDANLLHARSRSIRISIGTDAHSYESLSNMRYGVATARRGWLEKKDVINCLPTEGLLKLLRTMRG
jgi:DNA polymerase (family 10)